MNDLKAKIKRNAKHVQPTERLDFLTALAADPRLNKSSAVAVAVHLTSRRNGQTGLINPGIEAIARGAGCKRTAARHAVSLLEETGWFTIIRSKKRMRRKTTRTSMSQVGMWRIGWSVWRPRVCLRITPWSVWRPRVVRLAT
jgi:hypothetical protein